MQQVFTASQSFKLLFIDLKVNSPTALKRSPIAPLLVHIKIANMKVGDKSYKILKSSTLYYFAICKLEVNRFFSLKLDDSLISKKDCISKWPLDFTLALLNSLTPTSSQILQNLIKSRGADQKRSSAAQVYTAQKLCDLDKRVFDVVLKECNFEDAADHLITYLNKYYEASRPTQAPKRSDQLLRSSLNPSTYF